jgi:hypothetical protein
MEQNATYKPEISPFSLPFRVVLESSVDAGPTQNESHETISLEPCAQKGHHTPRACC